MPFGFPPSRSLLRAKGATTVTGTVKTEGSKPAKSEKASEPNRKQDPALPFPAKLSAFKKLTATVHQAVSPTPPATPGGRKPVPSSELKLATQLLYHDLHGDDVPNVKTLTKTHPKLARTIAQLAYNLETPDKRRKFFSMVNAQVVSIQEGRHVAREKKQGGTVLFDTPYTFQEAKGDDWDPQDIKRVRPPSADEMQKILLRFADTPPIKRPAVVKDFIEAAVTVGPKTSDQQATRFTGRLDRIEE
jgi:hypothetical protein